MLVLLPPSEGKTPPRRGRPVDLAALSHPELTAAREAVLRALPDGDALLRAPAAKASAVYTGVLFGRLGLAELPLRARRRVLIFSGLWGVISPDDRIPAYKLPIETKLPGIGGLAAHWRAPLRAALADEGLIVDMRSGGYAAAWRPRRGQRARRAGVRGARRHAHAGLAHGQGDARRRRADRAGGEPAAAHAGGGRGACRRRGARGRARRGHARRDRARLRRGRIPRMCFDADSLPPITPIAGAAVSHEDLVLEAPDGNRFAAFDAVPEDHIGTGVVVLPDVRGLYRFYEELALRFAERGVARWRSTTSAAPPGSRSARTTATTCRTSPRRATRRCRPTSAPRRTGCAAEGGDCRAVFTVGFCFGGSNSWLAATAGHGLSGAVGFYGRPGPRNDEPGPLDRAPDMQGTPILGLMGGADPGIPAADVAAFEAALADADVENEFVIYEGAPHSFFDRKYEEFQEASEDAWLRTLGFIAHHGGQDPR